MNHAEAGDFSSCCTAPTALPAPRFRRFEMTGGGHERSGLIRRSTQFRFPSTQQPQQVLPVRGLHACNDGTFAFIELADCSFYIAFGFENRGLRSCPDPRELWCFWDDGEPLFAEVWSVASSGLKNGGFAHECFSEPC